MTRKITAIVMTIAAITSGGAARAEDAPQQDQQTTQTSEEGAWLGVGFHDSDTPIGGRLWFPGRKIGLDLGAGFTSERQTITTDDRGERDETFGRFTASVGVPALLMKWPKLRVIFRPGLSYVREDVPVDVTNPITFFTIVNVEVSNTYVADAELEAEVFLTDNFSASASQGVQYSSTKLDLAGARAQNTITTNGSNFLTLGFHLYLWGNK